ncbi:sensor histidine kinase [Actinoplanes sp. NPDC051411]|uniref:sensor histidine kinase n=1 Tax=Actinoplanes sp. NPDC051411 TaxID=3155522 RepID=UPI003433BA3D
MARWTRDAALALIVLTIGLFGTRWAAYTQHGGDRLSPVAYLLVATAALALVARGRAPLAVLAASAAATSVYLILGFPYGPIQISLVVAVFTVGRSLPLTVAATACAAATVALLLHGVVGVSGATATGVLPFSAWTIVPFAVGVVARVTAEANARSKAERLLEERLRIAQEVHDVVGHGLSAINMQAEIALHLLPKRPEQAEEALTAISRTSREALDELRATLAVIRRSDPAGLRAPTPGLARLRDLVGRMSGTGVPVTVEITGTPGELPAAVDLAAYRLVQESLTNVLRHAGRAPVTVTIDHQPDELTVSVTDAGPGGPVNNGHGINGMRERVTALGGTFEAGPGPAGGFRVRGSFPL